MLKQSLSCILTGDGTKGGLFISNMVAAQNIALLKSNNIGAVITAARDLKLFHPFLNENNYLYVPADDSSQFKLIEYFDNVVEFISAQKQNTNVLIHCVAGVSRSVTLVVAYLIKTNKTRFIESFMTVKKRRNEAQPNPGFISQLYDYQAKWVYGKDSERPKQPLKQIEIPKVSFVVPKSTLFVLPEASPKQNLSHTYISNKYKPKGIISKHKSIHMQNKKVSFKFIEDETEVPQRENRSIKVKKILKNSVDHVNIKSQIKELKSNIQLLKERLKETQTASNQATQGRNLIKNQNLIDI